MNALMVTLLRDDKFKRFTFSQVYLASQRTDFFAISFIDFHINTKLRIPTGISPIRVYDIALI